MKSPSVVHSTFVIERSYPHPPSRVFAAFSHTATRRRWFAEGEGWHIDEFTVDFRAGGLETSRFRFKDGPPVRNDTIYEDIVADRRIVFAYVMTVNDQRISASLATVELLPEGGGTRLIYTEQGAFFDGSDGPIGRERGCRELYEKLAEELDRA